MRDHTEGALYTAGEEADVRQKFARLSLLYPRALWAANRHGSKAIFGVSARVTLSSAQAFLKVFRTSGAAKPPPHPSHTLDPSVTTP